MSDFKYDDLFNNVEVEVERLNQIENAYEIAKTTFKENVEAYSTSMMNHIHATKAKLLSLVESSDEIDNGHENDFTFSFDRSSDTMKKIESLLLKLNKVRSISNRVNEEATKSD